MAAFFTLPLSLAARSSAWISDFRDRRRQVSLALGAEHSIGPEFTFDGTSLQTLPEARFQAIAEQLQHHNIPCTVHLPFWDLHPGSFDDHILQATRQTLRLAMERAALLRPEHLVGHNAFDPIQHVPRMDDFLQRCIGTWEQAATMLNPGSRLLLENTHETTPEVLRQVLSGLCQRVAAERVGVCFDIGHWACFHGGLWKNDLEHWLDSLAPYLAACHIHDNDGSGDQHCAPGDGHIPFGRFFAALRDRHLTPTLVLEAHGEDAIQGAMQFLCTADGPWQPLL